MLMDKSKDNILKSIYDMSLLDEPVNLETLQGIPPTRKLQTIYFNLIWGIDAKLPKLDGIKSLLIFLEYFYIKFSEISKKSLFLISRKTEVYYLLLEQLLNLDIDKNDKTNIKDSEQYFYDKDFLSCFLTILNRQNNKKFKAQFSFYSKVRIYNI